LHPPRYVSPDTGSTPPNIAVIPSTKVHVKKLSADLVQELADEIYSQRRCAPMYADVN